MVLRPDSDESSMPGQNVFRAMGRHPGFVTRQG